MSIATEPSQENPISDADFESECESFLDAFPPRTTDGSVFRWGVGPDHVPIFEEVDRDIEATEIAAVRRWRRQLWESNLGWITGPVQYGGRGLPSRHQRIFDAMARSRDVPGNGKLTVSLGMVAPTILAHGDDALRLRYLPSLQDGSLIACQLFSEPDAGSDLASISTRASRDGDGWRVTGTKVWTSCAHYSDIGEVLCLTEAVAPRYRNLTMFLVDMRAPGVIVRPLRQMTGGAAFNEVHFDGVFIPDDHRLGDVGDGWRVALTTLSNERNAIGGDGFGGIGLLRPERYQQMVSAMGRADDSTTRQELASLIIQLKVAKLNRLRASANRLAGGTPGPEASIGKLELSLNYQRIARFVGLVLGSKLTADVAEWGTYSWASFVLGAPGMRIGGGTDEVMRNVLAERVLGLPKS